MQKEKEDYTTPKDKKLSIPKDDCSFVIGVVPSSKKGEELFGVAREIFIGSQGNVNPKNGVVEYLKLHQELQDFPVSEDLTVKIRA